MKLKKKYIDLAVNQTETLCRIPSPSGFTLKATEYLIDELKKIGFQPEYSRKKSVIVDLGGLCLNRSDSGLVGLFGRDPAAAGYPPTRQTLCVTKRISHLSPSFKKSKLRVSINLIFKF